MKLGLKHKDALVAHSIKLIQKLEIENLLIILLIDLITQDQLMQKVQKETLLLNKFLVLKFLVVLLVWVLVLLVLMESNPGGRKSIKIKLMHLKIANICSINILS